MGYIIKLDIKGETKKAYQLPNGSYIPKSCLDSRGLSKPYYQLDNWLISKCIEDIQNKNENAERSIQTLNGIKELVIPITNLPSEVLANWKKYWKSCYNEINTRPSNIGSTDRRWEIGEYELGIYD